MIKMFKNWKSIWWILFILETVDLFGQDCGTPDKIYFSDGGIGNVVGNGPCFNPDYHLTSCELIWVKVNVHVFLDDSCKGKISLGDCMNCDLRVNNITQLAEDYILRVNDFAAKMSGNIMMNNVFHGIEDTDLSQCFPIRFLLKGVYFHCDSKNQNIFDVNNYLREYHVNPESEINILWTNILPIGGSNPNGYTNFGDDFIVTEYIEGFGPSILIHEFGHIGYLDHPWSEYPDIPDTWNPSWRWDIDCNPATNPVKGNCCWDTYPYYQGLSACGNNFCQPHPCCSIQAQTNNLMAYSAFSASSEYCAITSAQTLKLLKALSLQKCAYIQQVSNNQVPVSAVISHLPQTSGDCNVTLDFRASMYEDAYKVEIFELTDNNLSLVKETGLVDGQAYMYRISLVALKENSLLLVNGLHLGKQYVARLTVYNKNGESSEANYTFNLPGYVDCFKQIKLIPESYPNPFENELIIKLNIEQQKLDKILVCHVLYGCHDFIINANTIKKSGEITIDTTGWKPGVYYIFIHTDQERIKIPVVKF